MAINMLSLPAYTEEMYQQGETSMTPGSGSLFNPNQLSVPGPMNQARDPQYAGMPDDMYNAMMEYNKAHPMGQMTMDIKPWTAWMADQRQQQPPNVYGGMTPGQALGGEGTMQPPPMFVGTPEDSMKQQFAQQQPPTPDQQLNTPSFEQLAQPNPALTPTDYAMPAPPPSVAPVPVSQPSPDTSNLIQQIQAPVVGAPTTQLPVTQPTPGASNLIKQIQAPTAPRPVARPNQATQQFAQQFRPQPAAQPRPQPAPRPTPVAKPQPAMRPAPVLQPKLAPRPAPRPAPTRPGLQVFPSVVSPRPMATSVSRVNPPLLPTRPMGRR